MYAYTAVGSNKVYYPGTEKTVQGYSSFGTIYYSSSSGNKIGEPYTALTGYYKYEGKLYDADGAQVNRSTSYYFGGTAKTLYAKGSALTSISGLYKKDDDENWLYTPIGSPANDMYQRNAEDDEVFTTIGDECTLQLGVLTTKEVTALTASATKEEEQ